MSNSNRRLDEEMCVLWPEPPAQPRTVGSRSSTSLPQLHRRCSPAELRGSASHPGSAPNQGWQSSVCGFPEKSRDKHAALHFPGRVSTFPGKSYLPAPCRCSTTERIYSQIQIPPNVPKCVKCPGIVSVIPLWAWRV